MKETRLQGKYLGPVEPGKKNADRLEGAKNVSLKFEFEDCGLFLRVQFVEIFFL